MFDADQQRPRVFALPCGVDFPQALVQGLDNRLADHAPEARARVEIIVNSARMRRRLLQALRDGKPRLHPRIRLLTDLVDNAGLGHLPTPVPPLRRRLELVQLVARLLSTQPTLAPRAAVFDLADSLAALMDEMRGEGVSPQTLDALDITDQSGHWQRSLTFLQILKPYFDASDDAPDAEALQRLAVTRLIAHWTAAPPDHPVLLAGSTGSRGTTRLLMQAVAGLPQGAVVLPGFDFDLPPFVWAGLTDALSGEDHPQFRFANLLQALDMTPDDVQPWATACAPAPAFNRVLSLALRPAPVTNQWLVEGPSLTDLPGTTDHITLLEAVGPREETQAIALRLRQAAETGQTAALITPDRMLTRRVTAALDRWGIVPDDSAGVPLQQTAPGRFLRLVSLLQTRPLTAEALIALLKHPLCHKGAERGPHLLHTRDLELFIRETALPYPDSDTLMAWANARDLGKWGAWLARSFAFERAGAARALTEWVDDHLQRAEDICAGAASGTANELWAKAAGRAARALADDLLAQASFGGMMTAGEYADLVAALLRRGEVRELDAPHPNILIWGTLEARVMGADLLILGGLNEGSWPEMPAADPWLNRRMRHDAGLLLPERRIGLSAHDFQQAAGAKQVWLSRALRSQEAETVPSRWLNRLTNLMQGLPGQGGPDALCRMRARGYEWLAMARALERPMSMPAAPRPAPSPPVISRPVKLSVTEVKTLVRDPYAIYAKHVLRLRPLNPLQRAPDYMLRGITLHRVFERFVKDVVHQGAPLTPAHLQNIARAVFAADVPWPAMRPVWQARIDRIADWFVAQEAIRQATARPVLFEARGKATLTDPPFTLSGTADRIDIDTLGYARIYDYKSGNPPSASEQRHFDKQLLLEAAMVTQNAFADIAPRGVALAAYIGLGATPVEVPAPLDEVPPDQVWGEFRQLIAAYQDPDRGYPARNAAQKEDESGDYDQLARFGEWDGSATPQKQDLT